MLGVGGVAPPCAPPQVVVKRPSISTKLRPNIFLCPVTNYTQNFSQGRNRFRLFAQKKKQERRSIGNGGRIELVKEAEFVEEEGFEIDDEFDDIFDEEDEDFDDDDDDEEVLDDDWLKNRPKGFGEGRVYDTSVEDKLMEEIEKSRKAQVVNVNKLKNAAKEAKAKKELKEPKVPEIVSTEIRVRINNLPKKMNVQRDLRAAFQGVRGIVNITPVNLGNSKTRDPICKGFGFVDFKSLEDANRFVQKFSGQSISFGKIQKQIKCEILKPKDSGDKGLAEHGHKSSSEPRFATSEDKLDRYSSAAIEETEPPLLFWEDDDFDEDYDDVDEDDFEILVMESEQVDDDHDDDDDDDEELDSSLDSSPLKQKRAKGEKKKPVSNEKPDKIVQPSIPGSAMRLKVRERADLDEVFSKYGEDSKRIITASEIIEDQDSEIEDQDSDIEDEDSDIEDEDSFLKYTESFLEFEDDDDFYEDDEEDSDIEDDEDIKAEYARKSEAEETLKKAPKTSVEELGELLRIRDPAVLEAVVSRLRGTLKNKRNEDSKSLLEFLAEKALKELEEKDVDLSAIKATKEAGAHVDAIKSKIAMAASIPASSSPENPNEKTANRKPKKTSGVKEKKKENKAKAPKGKVPGSANRLKGRDKAKLTDVFTKYGGK